MSQSSPARYVKKPVEIEAIQFTGENIKEVLIFVGSQINEAYAEALFINTLEGVHRAGVGDYIIKGVKGEFYPCKPDIFELTYTKCI